MRIAFLHMTMGLTNRGSEVTLDILCQKLCQKHKITVFQSGPVSPKPYHIKRVLPLKVAPPSAPTNIWEKLLSRMQLDKESTAVVAFTSATIKDLQNFDPDIVIAVNGSLQLKLLKQNHLKAKIVCFGHAGIGHHDRQTLLARPDLFVALSKPAKEWASNLASSKTKVVYIPNPIGVSKPKNLSLSLPSPIVLVVGAMTAYKNILGAVSAIKQTGYSLLLIGDGEEREKIEQELSSYPTDFRWIKHVEPAQIASYYNSSDIFCFVPDPQEAFGRVYLEAMSAGLPIVASDDPVRRSIIGGRGFYCDPHAQNQLVQQLQNAAQSPKIDYSRELEPYKLKTVLAQIEKEFHELVI